MVNLYNYVHNVFNSKERYRFPYDKDRIERLTDSNGLYVLFENGELYDGMDRIVRIGSHDGSNRLVKRLKDHFLSSKQRNSIFRKHIGRCILTKNNDNYLDAWNKPFKKIKDKERFSNIVNLEYEQRYETLISNHIQKNLSFTLIPKIYEKKVRDRIEEGLISMLNQSTLKTSSSNWLGNMHPDKRIRNAKLWNIEYLNDNPLSKEEFEELVETAH
jgi:hypothetical protein